MPRPIGDVLRDLDHLEVDVPAGLADEVWDRLFTNEPPVDIRTRRRPPWFLLTAAAALIALLATAAFIVLPTDEGALAIVRRARERFRNPPALTAVVARTVGAETLSSEAQTPVATDWVQATRIDYRDDDHWRAQIVEDTGNPGGDQTGSFEVSDGTYEGRFGSPQDLLTVQPAGAPGGTPPLILISPEQMNGSEEDCRFVDEDTVAGRRAQHISCAAEAIPGEVEPGQRTHAWFDDEYGTLLRIRHPNGISHEVRSIQYGVDHPDDRFVVAAPQGAELQWVGEGAAPEQFAPRRPTGPATTVVDPDRPGEVIVTPAGEVWVALNAGEDTDLSKGRIARLDATTGEVKDVVPVPKAPMAWPDDNGPRDVAAASDFAVIGDTLYVFDAFSYLVHRFDLRSRQFVGQPMVAGSRSGQPMQMLVHDGAVWIIRAGETGDDPGHAVRLSDDGSVAQSIPYRGFSFGNARFGHGSLWIPVDGALLRIDPATGATVARIAMPRADNKPLADDTGVWVMSSGDKGQVLRVDVSTNTITARIDMPGLATSAVTAGGRLWVLNPEGSSVTQIDPATNSVTTTIDVGLTPYGIAAGKDVVWITVGGTRSIVRIPV